MALTYGKDGVKFRNLHSPAGGADPSPCRASKQWLLFPFTMRNSYTLTFQKTLTEESRLQLLK